VALGRASVEIQRLSNVLSIERAPTYPYQNVIKRSQIVERSDGVEHDSLIVAPTPMTFSWCLL